VFKWRWGLVWILRFEGAIDGNDYSRRKWMDDMMTVNEEKCRGAGLK
jgi:hypothetical protein